MGPVSQPPNRSHDGHAKHGAGNTLVSNCGFDEFEVHVLEIARLFFLAFSEPRSEAWVDAFRLAEQVFPVPFGATIANAVLIALNDMRSTRLRPFTYINPRCAGCAKQITDEERYLISALKDIRGAHRGAAETNCMLLCEGGDTTALLASLERIAIITGDVEEPRFN